MTSLEANKHRIQNFLNTVWANGNLDALPDFWTPNCVNHAAPPGMERGLENLRAYHAQFLQAFADFADVQTDVVQQIAEGEQVASHLLSRATHRPTGKSVTLTTLRVDRLENGKIAEHWSVADMAGLMAQLA